VEYNDSDILSDSPAMSRIIDLQYHAAMGFATRPRCNPAPPCFQFQQSFGIPEVDISNMVQSTIHMIVYSFLLAKVIVRLRKNWADAAWLDFASCSLAVSVIVGRR